MKRRVAAAVLAILTIIAVSSLTAPGIASAAGTSAVAVIGQGGSFTSSSGGSGANGLSQPSAMAFDSAHRRLFVSEPNKHRVLVFNLNANNSLVDETADYVLGQPDFATTSYATTATKLNVPAALAYDEINDRLYVADAGNKRVLLFNTTALVNGQAAVNVIGQTDFTSSGGGLTQSALANAEGVALGQGNRYLYVADKDNRRVMVFDTNAIGNGMAATYVIGQSSFTAGAYAVNQTTTLFPYQLSIDKATNRLVVPEGNRVSVFDLSSVAIGMNALYVLGQPDFFSNGAGSARNRFNSPLATAAGGGRIWVTDRANHRVLVFDASNTTNGQDAIAAYGQPDFVSNANNNGGTSAESLSYPTGLAFDPLNFRVWVADALNCRLLGYNAVTSGVQLTATVAPIFAFSVVGRSTICNGQSATGFQTGSSATAVSLGTFSPTAVNGAAQDLSVTSNAAGGFTVFVRTTNASPALRDVTTHAIADVAGTQASPGSAPVAGTESFGFTSSDVSTPFTSNKWAKLTGVNGAVVIGASNTTSKSACVGFAAAVATTTIAGTYSVPVVYTAVPSF